MEGNTLQSPPRASTDSKYLDVPQGTVGDWGMAGRRDDLHWEQTSHTGVELRYFYPAFRRTFSIPFRHLSPALQSSVVFSIF